MFRNIKFLSELIIGALWGIKNKCVDYAAGLITTFQLEIIFIQTLHE